MRLVTISNGIFRSKPISGTFQLVREYKDESWKGKPRQGKVIILDDGQEKGVWVDRKNAVAKTGTQADVTVAAPTAKAAKAGRLATVHNISDIVDVRSDAQVGTEIEQRFSVMNRMTDGVINGMVKSVIIAGAPGVGKSFELEGKLEKAEAKGKIKFVRLSGVVSGIGLYKTLFLHSEKHNVVVLDDIDRVFGDEDTLNILKAALDTGKKRTITWGTDSRTLKDEEIPNSFEFRGSVVFITNMNFDKVINSGNKIAPHINALMSRTVYVDLGIHTNREIMVRIEQVIKKGDIFADRDLTKGQKDAVINWIRTNYQKMRKVSLREVLHLGDMVAVDPKNWQELAEVTMFKPTRHF